MMTGFSEMRRWILISVDSVTSMASGEVVVGVSSRRTPPSVNVRKRRTPCIAGEEAEEEEEEEEEKEAEVVQEDATESETQVIEPSEVRAESDPWND